MNKSLYSIWITGAAGILGKSTANLLAQAGHQLTGIYHQQQYSTDMPVNTDFANRLIIDFGKELQEWPSFPSQSPDIILHFASAPAAAKTVDLAGTKRLISWLRNSSTSPHIIYISIVGVHKSNYPYYQIKFKTEKLLLDSGLPVTVLRTTQFHHFIESMLENIIITQLGKLSITTQTDRPVIYLPKAWRFQPVSVGEVASRLAALCTEYSVGLLPDFGGPQILNIQEIISSYAAARQILITWEEKAMPELGPRADLFAGNDHLCPDFRTGVLSWQNYLSINSDTGFMGN